MLPSLRRACTCLALAVITSPCALPTQQQSVEPKLKGFDAYMAKVMKDWDAPGIGVGIVVKDKLVFAKGYGYRDYGRKLPYTPTTLQPIASNTKLFTASTVGFLVSEGKLDWDRPVKQYVPEIQFYNDELNRTVTIHDMLAHRTGITRHDLIWYKSSFSQRELFDRLRYLEPAAPLRTTFLYNNLMYAGAGYVVQLLSGKPWESFVRDSILTPLGMTSTVFTIDDMLKSPDHGVAYDERRDSTVLYEIPYYRAQTGIAPAGAIISNIQDMSKWLIAQMHDGVFNGKRVLPAGVVKQTLAPSIAMPNTGLEERGYGELLNAAYGMGRWTASYRGHLLAYHGGDINGFHSQISMMPYDSIGVIVFVIGDHAAPLYNVISYNVYERLLGLSLTPWSERLNAIRLRNKAADRSARGKAGEGRVPNTHPSHPLDDYVGEFEHPAYGVVTISRGDSGLVFNFHNMTLPLSHFHYDRFDTPNDEENGKWSVNFLTNPQGEVDRAEMSLDESAVVFTRRAPAVLSSVATLRRYLGTYRTPSGGTIDVVLRPDTTLAIRSPDGSFQGLIPWQPNRFRTKEFPDMIFTFAVENGRATSLKQSDPSGEYTFVRQ